MILSVSYEGLTLPSMAATALALALFWGIILERTRKIIFNWLAQREWWPNAIHPQKSSKSLTCMLFDSSLFPSRISHLVSFPSVMYNFGYPKDPTEKFPNGVTEVMARDSYAYTINILSAHLLSALPMLPVVIYGWEGSSNMMRSAFLLGTLSDLGFDIYDAMMLTIRTFTKHESPIPFDFWVVIVAMHHTTALFLVLPLNLKYLHRWEYHQTAVSLLLAAALCFFAGLYKFTLNVFGRKKDFYIYKLIVLFQLAVLLYTRLYLWFPTVLGLRAHLKEQNDTAFFYVSTVMITIFSLFNLILVYDGIEAAVKWIPRKFPETKADRRASEAIRRTSAIDGFGVTVPTIELIRKIKARRKFRGAVHSVIASNRMSSHASSSEKDD